MKVVELDSLNRKRVAVEQARRNAVRCRKTRSRSYEMCCRYIQAIMDEWEAVADFRFELNRWQAVVLTAKKKAR